MSSFLGGSGSPAELAWSIFVLLGTVVLFVAGWRVLARVARRHRDADSRAPGKALVAGVLGLGLGLGGFALLANFEAKSEVGIHTTFVKALNQTVGEGDYLEAVKAKQAKPAALAIQQARLDEANAALKADPGDAKAQEDQKNFAAAVDQTKKEIAAAELTLKLLASNHAVWLRAQPHLLAGTDAEDGKAREILDAALDPARITTVVPADVACKRDATTGDCLLSNGQPTPAAIAHSFRDIHTLSDVPVAQGVPEAYEHREQFRAQMESTLAWFVYPGITGLFLAPFAFAGGSILNAAFEPSDTVGFKPYPGKAAGFFLLLGAFGLFAIPFGAWTLRDLHKRSLEGQIAL
ncbi:MAG: hypothetical protein LC623_05625 [Halobacteriales archaeon]|nr:hypothetical protein [Halobacteriales archaeon]